MNDSTALVMCVFIAFLGVALGIYAGDIKQNAEQDCMYSCEYANLTYFMIRPKGDAQYSCMCVDSNVTSNVTMSVRIEK